MRDVVNTDTHDAERVRLRHVARGGDRASGKSIPYEEVDLERAWKTFDIQHELTRKGIEKFAADYRATLSRSA